MNSEPQKIALPAYLRKNLEAFRVGQGESQTFIIKDPIHDQEHRIEPWQYFILEVLPGCEDFEKLAAVFEDRFGYRITEAEMEGLFSHISEQKLFGLLVDSNPLLSSFRKKRMAAILYATAKRAAQKATRVEIAPEQSAATNTNFQSTPDTQPVHAPGPIDPDSAGTPDSEKAPDLNGGANGPGHCPDKTSDSKTRSFSESPETDRATVKPATPKAEDMLVKRGLNLFNPTTLLKMTAPLWSPLKYLLYLMPVFLLAAIVLAIRHATLLEQDITRLQSFFDFFSHVFFSMLTVNLLATWVSLATAYTFRATTDGFCLTLRLGIMPRFAARISDINQLTRREQMWLHAAPLLLRPGLFATGLLLWFNTRAAHASISFFGLAIAGISLLSFILTANPLIKSNAYHLVATFLNTPNLRAKAFAALLNRFSRKTYQKADNHILAAYGLVSALFFTILVSILMILFGRFAHLHVGNVGIFITCLIGLTLLFKMIASLKQANQAYIRSMQFQKWRDRNGLLPATADQPVGDLKRRPASTVVAAKRRPAMTFFMWTALFVIFGAMQIPYAYEPGGQFVIIAYQKQDITTDLSGVIEAIHFEGGEMLSRGTVIGKLSDSDHVAQVKITTAKIKEQESIINELISRPRPEEVKLAESEVRIEKTRVRFSKEKLDRMVQLFRERAISLEEFDTIRRDYEIDLDRLREKQSHLELVKSGAPPDQIAAAQAKLESWHEECRRSIQKVEESVFYMPFDGKLTTMNLKQKIGGYLAKGEVLATAENTQQAIAQIAVPETDIGFVAENTEVHLRPISYVEDPIVGMVTSIDTQVTDQSNGKFVTVNALIDNSNGLLKSGMSGYAKISGRELPIWRVLSLAVFRFFKVEVWSWLP